MDIKQEKRGLTFIWKVLYAKLQHKGMKYEKYVHTLNTLR